MTWVDVTPGCIQTGLDCPYPRFGQAAVTRFEDDILIFGGVIAPTSLPTNDL